MEENRNIEIEAGNKPESVPYIVFEGELARLEAIHKEDKERSDKKFNKVFWALVGAVILLVGSNVGWLIYESQFVDEITETVEATAEGDGDAYGTIISGDNSEVHYGESNGNTNPNQNPQNGR